MNNSFDDKQRLVWTFPYTAKDVLKGAKTKFKLHSERLAWWKKQEADVMKTCKAKGLSVEQDIGVANYGATKALRGARIVVDERLQDKLNECHTKIALHAGLAKEYGSWVKILEEAKETPLYLTHNDYLFFFGE